MDEKAYDVFISHASEDKASFVAPLANSLSEFGVKVWYDEFSLTLGDSLSRSIDQGLARSQFGLVVLSPYFIAKKWPEYELRGLTAREMQGSKIILPIWHNVTREDVLQFSPPLADKLAILSTAGSPMYIAISIISVIRPDIFTRIHRRLAHLLAKGHFETVEPSKLTPSPIRHENLPDELVGRIRLVRAALLGVYSHSMEFWLDGFRRDAHPSKEVAFWEHVATVYLEYVKMTRLATEQHDLVLRLIFSLPNTQDETSVANITSLLPEGAYETLRNLHDYKYPVYDIEDKIPWQDDQSADEISKYLDTLDKEAFPRDVPDDLIRQVAKELQVKEDATHSEPEQ